MIQMLHLLSCNEVQNIAEMFNSVGRCYSVSERKQINTQTTDRQTTRAIRRT